jgi:hypothetical protein
MDKGLNSLYDDYIAWRKVSQEMIIDGYKGSTDCGEAIVREDFSKYAELKEVINFDTMKQLEEQYREDEY